MKTFAQLGLISLLALLLGLGPALIPAVGLAQDVATDEIVVTSNEVAPEFPNGIDFSLTASSSVEPIVKAEVFFRPTHVETLRLGTAEIEPGAEIAVTYEADLRGGRLPPGVDITYFWRLEDAAGTVLETPEQVMLWADDRYAWEAIEGDRVTVYAYNGDAAFNQTILETAERTIESLSEAYSAEMSHPIRIWAYSNSEDFYGALAPNSEPWIAGASYPKLGLILSVLPPGNMEEVGRVVPHEVSHQVLHQATKNPFNEPPVWLDEGLAIAAQETGSANFPRVVQRAAENGMLEPIPVLNSQFPYDTEGALLGYAQSESIVNFIVATYGEEAMADLIAIFRDGVSYEEAVQTALGVSLDDLDEQWRDSLDFSDDGAEAGAGTTGGSGPFGTGGGGSGLEQIAALASGTLVMGLVALLAVLAGGVVIARGRRRSELPDGPDIVSSRRVALATVPVRVRR